MESSITFSQAFDLSNILSRLSYKDRVEYLDSNVDRWSPPTLAALWSTGRFTSELRDSVISMDALRTIDSNQFRAISSGMASWSAGRIVREASPSPDGEPVRRIEPGDADVNGDGVVSSIERNAMDSRLVDEIEYRQMRSIRSTLGDAAVGKTPDGEYIFQNPEGEQYTINRYGEQVFVDSATTQTANDQTAVRDSGAAGDETAPAAPLDSGEASGAATPEEPVDVVPGVPAEVVASAIVDSTGTSSAIEAAGAANAVQSGLDWIAASGLSPMSNPKDASALVDEWNSWNPEDRVDSWDELAPKLSNAQTDAVARLVVENVASGEDVASVMYKVRLDNGQYVAISQQQLKDAKDYIGSGVFTTRELGTVVRWAAQARLADSTGQVAWQPAMAILRALGTFDPRDSDLDPKRQVAVEDVSGVAGARAAGVASDAVDRMGSRVSPRYTNMMLKPLVAFRIGLQKYGNNVGFAYLHSVDPQLAQKLATTNPEKWSPSDVQRANQWMIRGGVVNESTNLGRAGYTASSALLNEDLLMFHANAGRGAGSGAVRTMPDPVAVRQAAKEMYRSLFVDEASDAEVERLAGQISSIISSAPMSQNVDVESRIRDLLLNNGMYKALYGKMPKGMSEAEYQNQFRQAAATMLGVQAPDPSMVKAGMRTGNYQTTIGAAATQKSSWDNSTFMGRLAAAAQVVSENT